MSRFRRHVVTVVVVALLIPCARANDTSPTSAERGRKLLLGQAFSPPIFLERDYANLWKVWGLPGPPEEMQRAIRERYGLHTAPYDNAGLPMGLRPARDLIGRGVAQDCMLCHAGSIAGKSYVGLPNSTLDLQALLEDSLKVNGLSNQIPLTYSNVRGTFEAVAVVSFLMEFRDADLNFRPRQKLGFRTDLCEDVPAWWHLKKKKTMYHTGGVSTRSVRSLMSFMLSPVTTGREIKSAESKFADIKAYLLTLEPPRYPFAIDHALAARGKTLFEANCSRCHGTYGPGGVYPSKIVPLDVIQTDPSLAQGYTIPASLHYINSWFGQERGQDGQGYIRYTGGYQAPPLDGLWASAPYLHNASVPTVYHVLNSKARPAAFTRSYRTEVEDYDARRLGWKVTELPKSAGSGLPAVEQRKIYDTSLPGRSNSGHTFGDSLAEADRMAVIEYLKTL